MTDKDWQLSEADRDNRVNKMSMEKEFEAVQIQRSNGRTDFVHLAEQVAQAMVQSCEEQVAKAQATLEQTRKDAEELLATVKSKDQEIADMTSRIAALGEQVLEANRAFHAAATESTARSSPSTRT